MTHPNGLTNGLTNGQPVHGQQAPAQSTQPHAWPATRQQAHPQDPNQGHGGYSGYQQQIAAQPAQSWQTQAAHAPVQAAIGYQPQTQNPYAAQQGYHSQPAAVQAPHTAQHQQYAQQHGYGYADPYAQPSPAQAQTYAFPDSRLSQQAAQTHRDGYEPQWPANTAQDPRGYDIGTYHPVDAGQHHAQGYAGNGYGDPNSDQHYDGHEDGEYEAEEPRRGSRLTMIAAALVGAVAIGGALAYGYTNFIAGDGSTEPTPVIKSAEGPSKTKPADPGGKQFSHSDSKIMGRLGEGGSESPANTASNTETDANGARKVQTLVVGRDGSINNPSTTVPGMTVVDAFGGKPPPPIETAAVTPPAAAIEAKPAVATAEKPAVAAQKPISVSPPVAPAVPVKPAVVAKAAPATPTVSDAVPVTDKVTPPPATPKTVTAAVDPAATPAKKPAATAPVSTSSTGNGFVAVLASVPVSANSRMSALKQFADMQQKYATALQSKQPDVQEANLGDKGKYHRLLVGPPGSREQASALCGQLKSHGYNDCWVMAYL